jgi:hypothetical protein
VCFANARRALDLARARRDRDRALGRLLPQVEFLLRRIERRQLGQPATDNPPKDALLLHCARGWEHGDETTYASLRELKQTAGICEEELRAALDRLATAGEIQLCLGKPRGLVSATDLAAHSHSAIVADWHRINGNRPRPS